MQRFLHSCLGARSLAPSWSLRRNGRLEAGLRLASGKGLVTRFPQEAGAVPRACAPRAPLWLRGIRMASTMAGQRTASSGRWPSAARLPAVTERDLRARGHHLRRQHLAVATGIEEHADYGAPSSRPCAGQGTLPGALTSGGGQQRPFAFAETPRCAGDARVFLTSDPRRSQDIVNAGPLGIYMRRPGFASA